MTVQICPASYFPKLFSDFEYLRRDNKLEPFELNHLLLPFSLIAIGWAMGLISFAVNTLLMKWGEGLKRKKKRNQSKSKKNMPAVLIAGKPLMAPAIYISSPLSKRGKMGTKTSAVSA